MRFYHNGIFLIANPEYLRSYLELPKHPVPKEDFAPTNRSLFYQPNPRPAHETVGHAVELDSPGYLNFIIMFYHLN